MGNRAEAESFRGERAEEPQESFGIEPLTLRAVRASVTRRKRILSSADQMVATINAQIEGFGHGRNAATPPDAPAPHRAEHEPEAEEAISPRTPRERKLANAALVAVGSAETT